jgi:2TM domain
VINVPAEMLTEHERTASQIPPATSVQDDELRQWARRHLERVRRLKRDVAVFVLGTVALSAVWALVQWQDNGAFERFSGGDNPGDWEPWILYVAVIWGFFLAADALKVYFDRPTTEAEIDRQIERLRSGGGSS